MQADSLPAELQGKPRNTGVGSRSLLQWIFPIHESNRGLLHCRWILYQLSYQGALCNVTGIQQREYICKQTFFILKNLFLCHPSSRGIISPCNVGDPGLIPGSGRSPGEIGYPLQYSWASLVAQLVKNPPAVWEIWVQSLGWEDPLQKGKATHSSILAWRIPWTV